MSENGIKGVDVNFNKNLLDNSTEKEFANDFKSRYDSYIDRMIETVHLSVLESETDKMLEDYLQKYKGSHKIDVDNMRKTFRDSIKKDMKEKVSRKYLTGAFAQVMKDWYRDRPGDLQELKNYGISSENSDRGFISLPSDSGVEFKISSESVFEGGIRSVFFFDGNKSSYLIFNPDGTTYVDATLSKNIDGVKINSKKTISQEKLQNIKAIIDINQGLNIVDTIRNLVEFLKAIGGLELLEDIESLEGFEFFGGYKLELLKNETGDGLSFRILRPSSGNKEEGFVNFDKDLNFESLDFENENMYQGRLLTTHEKKGLEKDEERYAKELGFEYSDIDLLINKLTGSPKDQQEVIDFLTNKRTRYYETSHRKDLDDAFFKGSPYFQYMRGVINSETDTQLSNMKYYDGKTREEIGMPITMVDRLAYLSIPESHWTDAESFAGAHGPLQIMPSTARLFGMKMGGLIRKDIHVGSGDDLYERPYYVVDQRRDPIASAKLEAKHMFAPESRGKSDIRYIDFRLRLAMYNGSIVNSYFNSVPKGSRPDYSGYLKYLGMQLKDIKHKVKGKNAEDPADQFKRAIRFIRENLEYPFKFYAVLKVIDRNKGALKKQEYLQMEEIKILPKTIKPKEYTIKPGDNYQKIASDNKLPIDVLLRYNGIQKKDHKNIKAGNTIKIPYKMSPLSLNDISASLKLDINELLKLNPAISPEGINYNLLSMSGFSLYLPVGRGRDFNNVFGKINGQVVESDITMFVDGKIRKSR